MKTFKLIILGLLLIPLVSLNAQQLKEVREYFDQSSTPDPKTIKSKGHVDEHGDKQGEWTYYKYHRYGSIISSKGTYKNDKRDGDWELYNDGKLQWEGQYKNGNRVGQWTQYNGKGETVNDVSGSKHYNDNGKLHGMMRFYYDISKGLQNSEVEYENGVAKPLTWKQWYRNGQLALKTEEYDGKYWATVYRKSDSDYILIEAEGEVDTKLRRQGVWSINWTHSETLREKTHYVDNEKHGTSFFYETNEVKLSESQDFYQGKERGYSIKYYLGTECIKEYKLRTEDKYKSKSFKLKKCVLRSELDQVPPPKGDN